MIPARLLGTAVEGGRPVELLMLRPVGEGRWEALVQPGRRCRVGARVELAGGAARARIVGEAAGGARVVEIEAPWPVRELLERHGLPPLPPYITRHDAPKPEDRERYQTVYARDDGLGGGADRGAALHAGAAGAARASGASRCTPSRCTWGRAPSGRCGPRGSTSITWRRSRSRSPRRPRAPSTDAKREGRRVVAVGTTTTRALEWATGEDGRLREGAGAADLFIRPGHRFRAVDALVTNFHLPRSTLLVLVAALAGRDLILDAYRHAVAARYRFYSYGDAMLIQ